MRDFPGGPQVKTLYFHCRRAWVLPLVGELRSVMPHSVSKKNKIMSEIPPVKGNAGQFQKLNKGCTK